MNLASDASPESGPGADHVLVLVNPTAGRRAAERGVARFVELLRALGGYVTETSNDLDQACQQADWWHAQGRLRGLVVVGGDGTVSEVVNRTRPGVPLALFPAGTSNLIARHLGMEPNADLLYRTVASARVARWDLGRASGRLFVAMASCGFDAQVAWEVHFKRLASCRAFRGYWSYVKPTLQCIRSYQYPEIRVYWGGSPQDASAEPTQATAARWVFVFNLPRYGWGLPLAPWAREADGLLDLCTFRRGSLPVALYYLAAVQLGLHRRLADCNVQRVRRLRITADAEVRYQLDGDPAGLLPVDIEVVPGRMSVLVPPERPAAHPPMAFQVS
ncbi:MAG: diacylglycerol/lipid kinase family protein [Thermoguttaceae bacterium]